ncbi:hypothetical protein B0H16DRAFT_1797630 [Mycena metata]|uniref:F-box domain-containing protein n=1 Tax=Mycena metata TaxID=1033252 RepID=A0AAD7HDF0_9AGAR|nr:hypothetical protein B0H16DRAFT_1797630 [Mycena metata]
MENGTHETIANRSILDTYPELLFSAAGPPSDAQAVVLMAEIERAEKEISSAIAEAARLKDALNKLAQHRANLKALIRLHKGVLSGLRRLPEEILLEIFQRTFTPLENLHPPCNAPWLVSQVCRRWRAVALASPRLWRHFVFPTGKAARPLFVANNFPAQVERVRGGPVSIRVEGKPPREILTSLLQISSQWENISLDISSFLSPQLSDHVFSALTTLCLFHQGSGPTTDVSRTDVLPALEQLVLSLYNHGLPRGLRSLIPWSQLRDCHLSDLDSLDFLWIAARLPQDANLVVDAGYDKDESLPSTSPPTSLIRSLTLNQCYRSFLADVLDVLSVPALDTFFLRGSRGAFIKDGVGLGARVARFLDRSACTLTHLEFTADVEEHDLVHLLKSPHVRSVIDLKIGHMWPTPPVLAALAEGPLPNLRRLTLGGFLDESLVMEALARHNRPRISSSLPLGDLQVILTGLR